MEISLAPMHHAVYPSSMPITTLPRCQQIAEVFVTVPSRSTIASIHSAVCSAFLPSGMVHFFSSPFRIPATSFTCPQSPREAVRPWRRYGSFASLANWINQCLFLRGWRWAVLDKQGITWQTARAKYGAERLSQRLWSSGYLNGERFYLKMHRIFSALCRLSEQVHPIAIR